MTREIISVTCCATSSDYRNVNLTITLETFSNCDRLKTTKELCNIHKILRFSLHKRRGVQTQGHIYGCDTHHVVLRGRDEYNELCLQFTDTRMLRASCVTNFTSPACE